MDHMDAAYDHWDCSEDDQFMSSGANRVVMRHPRSSRRLLEDSGDGAEADLLGTTPPRSRKRGKNRTRTMIDRNGEQRGPTTDPKRLSLPEQSPDWRGRRSGIKVIRNKERDFKQSQAQPEGPALVEMCNRFKSLWSWPKCPETEGAEPRDAGARGGGQHRDSGGGGGGDEGGEDVPEVRVNFHKTFSMLINMGNADKNCRRTISREEQVWQSELKDLIWLELRARIAGRSLPQQDAVLCAQRGVVPHLVHDILHYRFVNPNPCGGAKPGAGAPQDAANDDELFGCLSFTCRACNDAISKALAEVGSLLDAFYSATTLYPSSKAMTLEHKQLATERFENRLKAMCLWYNLALHMRLMLAGVSRLLRSVRPKERRVTPAAATAPATPAIEERHQAAEQSSDGFRQCRVRFDCSDNPANCSKNSADCSNNPADRSNNPADCNENRADCSDNPIDCSIVPTESSGNPSDNGHNDSSTHLKAKEFNSTAKKSIEDEQENEVEQNYVDKNAVIESDGDGGSRPVGEEEGRHSNEEEKSETAEVGDEADKVLLGQDYTDGSSRKSELSDLPTPEIVLSGSQYSTSETIASNESGYSSMRAGAETGAGVRAAVGVWAGVGGDEAGRWELSALQELAALRLLGRCQVSPYRPYHFEKLKTQGVRRSMIFIQKMRRHLLDKVYLTFDNTAPSQSEPLVEECGDHTEVFLGSPAEEEKREPGGEGHISEEEANELRRFGCNSAECRAMRLPSYRNHFLLLSSICMEAVHDYLALRLEGRPEEPSCLTVKQLIHELKEGLDIATDVRAVFVRNVAASLRGGGAGGAAPALPGGARPAGGAGGARTDLLLLIRTFDGTVETVLKQYLSYLRTMSSTEHMGRACLEAEWAFTARLARRVRCAALLAPACFTDIACNQLNRIEKQFKCKFEELDKKTGEEEAEYSKYAVYAVCRAAQSVYACERDATLHAAQWARTLAARLQRAPQPTQRHLRARIFESLMSIRDCIVRNCAQIMARSRLAEDEARDLGELVGVRVRELLLQIYKLAFELHKVLYEFAQAPFKAAADGWGRTRPMSLQPPRPQGAAHRRRRPETMVVNESFNPMIHKELHRFVNSSRQPGAGGGGGGGAGGESGRPPRPRYLPSLSACDDLDGADRLLELATQGDAQNAFLSEAAPPGSEVGGEDSCEAVGAEVERSWAARAARAVIELARCWMQFVMERCDRGRGLRPRWASQGLEFLMLACDPCNTKHLSNEEFEELKHLMDECISHVIGSRPPAPRAPDPAPAPPAPPPRARPRPGAGGAGAGREREPLTPPPPPSDADPLINHHADPAASHSARVAAATRRLDAAREQKLLSLRAIGRVREAAVAPFEPRLRQVTFKWQRGLKIGAGTFGKVYTVVNTETGQLLAMKELSVGVGDRRALQRAANELQLLEGVIHPHLVRYYGCEVHRDEMLIFMELCVEGSLEALVAGTGALAEGAVRRYTRQLLSAVHALHQRSIVHRDIKSGNVFLTNDGHCLKLGDFGCAVKIRANTTAVGELQGYVGTQAYMAPEVFMKSSGHGRAADIWSLGCVVTEMASGKRPFAEYDSNYQIMFVVGMGGRPAIPATLSAEGADFCARCLTHDPDMRPRADALAMHTFLMLQSDEDCKCEPGRLLGNTDQCSRERGSEV